MCMYTYTLKHLHILLHTPMHAQVCVCMHTYIWHNTCIISTYTCIHTHARMCVCVHAHPLVRACLHCVALVLWFEKCLEELSVDSTVFHHIIRFYNDRKCPWLPFSVQKMTCLFLVPSTWLLNMYYTNIVTNQCTGIYWPHKTALYHSKSFHIRH